MRLPRVLSHSGGPWLEYREKEVNAKNNEYQNKMLMFEARKSKRAFSTEIIFRIPAEHIILPRRLSYTLPECATREGNSASQPLSGRVELMLGVA